MTKRLSGGGVALSSGRLDDPRIPASGSVPAAERMFRINWVAAEFRSPSGIALLGASYVARLGQAARLVDLRTAGEVAGPLGYIPGSEWVPLEGAVEALAALPDDEPVVLISRGGERAGEVARALEGRGKTFVAALFGGVLAWRQAGLGTVRDGALLGRAGVLGPSQAHRESSRRELSREDIEEHVGDPRDLRWMKAAALLVNGRLSCVDGRDDSGILGTPGGDAGEFLLALAAVERVSGRPLEPGALSTLLLRWFDAFGHFYFHTDVEASDVLIASLRSDRRFDAALADVAGSLGWRRFFAGPPVALREALLEHLVRPAHLGCGHLRLALTEPAHYGVRPALVEGFIRAFMTSEWHGHDESELIVLPGNHAEGAVVNVVVEHGVEAFSRIPLVSPTVAGSQMFIHHPQVSAFLRRQVVGFLAQQGDVAPLGPGGEVELSRVLAGLGATQIGHTLSHLAPGLPIYEVRFGSGGGARVTAAGRVGPRPVD